VATRPAARKPRQAVFLTIQCFGRFGGHLTSEEDEPGRPDRPAAMPAWPGHDPATGGRAGG
jgi:hypothetical protein